MNLLHKIFGRLNVLRIRFDGDGSVVFFVVPCVMKKGKFAVEESKSLTGKTTAGELGPVTEIKLVADIAEEKSTLAKFPLVAVVSGKGVITKEVAGASGAAAGIADTVMGDPETFLWTVADDGFSFVRREQLTTTIEELAKFGIKPLYIECLPDLGGQRAPNAAVGQVTDAGLKQIEGVAERFGERCIGWRKIVRPSEEGSRLAMHVAKRARLPVLGVLLAILAINFAISAKVREGFQAASTEFSALQRSSSALTVKSEERRAVLERFSRPTPHRASRLSDRIGGAVPAGVALTEIAIAPLKKSPENGKPVDQRENIVVVRGEAETSEAVAEFTGSLGRLGLGTIRLAAVEQNAERGVLEFIVEITI